MSKIPAELGDRLRDRYELERELGRGGMATVWLARDLKHDRLVALKVLRAELAAALGPERFLHEIRTAARLQHPHILPVFDSGEAGPSVLFYTMPFVEGESLRDRLRRGRLPVGEAVRLAREAAQALQYAHEHGVVHRDVKPENILLTRDGSTLVADFGIARTVGTGTQPLTATGLILGTPAYMSPEQAAGEREVDGRSDVYSLGCVLYEMLAGEPPFSGPNVQAVLSRHLVDPPPSLAAHGVAVPEALDRAVSRALAKTPAERFASAAELGAALAAALDGSASGGSASGGAGRSTPGRRRMAILALGGVAALGLFSLARSGGSAAGAADAGGAVASGFNRKLAQITSAEGVEEEPAWSPDGGRLAYVAEVDGHRQLFVRTLATGEERRVTSDARDHLQPAWSPDARRLAFVRATASDGRLQPTDIDGWYQDGGELRVVDLATGAEHRLATDAFGPAYSPDGARLAFDARWAGPRRIWIADTLGHNPRQVTSDSSEAVVHTEPHWSPDGTRLAFRRIEKSKSDIVVVDLASQGMTRLTNDLTLDQHPVWSPDGRHVYFASSRGGGVNLWRVPVGTGDRPLGPPEQVTTGAGDDVHPAPAPDGRRVAFAVRGINSDLWRLPVDPGSGRPAGEPEPVVQTTRVESRGAWSPDGKTIAFNSDRSGEMNLWLYRAADRQTRQLTAGPGGDYQPAWSPDAETIAFFSARAGNTDVWAVRVRDGRLTRLTDDPAMDTNPAWSPDGRRIAFLSDRGGRAEVWVMNADGSDQRRITSVGAGGHFLLWTKDGQAVVFRAETGTQTRVHQVSLADGGLSTPPDVQSGAHMSFSPSRALLLDVRGHKSLWAHPVDGRGPYRVFEFADPDVRIDYPVWSPDGRWVLFDRAAPRGGDLWVLEGIE